MDDSKKVKVKPKDETLEMGIKKKCDLISAKMQPTTVSQQQYINRLTARILILAENIDMLPKLGANCQAQKDSFMEACRVLDGVLHNLGCL